MKVQMNFNSDNLDFVVTDTYFIINIKNTNFLHIEKIRGKIYNFTN